MPKKKIVIFGVKYFPAKGGTSRVVENLLEAMHDTYDFTIYCYQHPKAAQHIKGVKTIQFPEIPIKGVGVFIYYLICCFHLLWKGHYDLVHLHKTDGAFFLPLLTRKFKVISTSHALPYLNDKWSGIGKYYFRVVERLFMESDSTITAISLPQTQYYSEQYQRPVHFIPNGIHPVKPVQVAAIEKLRKAYELPERYLLFAARRVIPLKGCHTLIAALQEINFTGTLIIAGDYEQMPNYTQQLKKSAAGLDVRFIGYVAGMEKLNALIKGADFFIFPSEIEGMSMMLLEAGSLGTPMICSDIPQNKAVLTEQEVLYFVSKDSGDLARQLTYAFAHPQEMKTFAAKTVDKVEQEYLISGVTQKYANLYEGIMRQSAGVLEAVKE